MAPTELLKWFEQYIEKGDLIPYSIASEADYRHTQDVSRLLLVIRNHFTPVYSVEHCTDEVQPKVRFIVHIFELVLKIRFQLFGLLPRFAISCANSMQKFIASHVVREPQVH